MLLQTPRRAVLAGLAGCAALIVGRSPNAAAQQPGAASADPESPAAREALRLKQAARERAKAVEAPRFRPETKALEAPVISAFYRRYGTGSFSNLDRIRLRWLGLKDTSDPNYFALIPHKDAAFSFQRPNSGAVIAPRHMFTDGGSVPWLAQALPNLSSWGYGPAYLIHDWLFDLHHCHRSDLDFDAARDIMMEAVKTLMETGVCAKSELSFWLLFQGIDSASARAYWAADPGGCTLPPDYEE
jgi:Protein of unknown function (DUF1353)